jgi:hypothetical protein
VLYEVADGPSTSSVGRAARAPDPPHRRVNAAAQGAYATRSAARPAARRLARPESRSASAQLGFMTARIAEQVGGRTPVEGGNARASSSGSSSTDRPAGWFSAAD